MCVKKLLSVFILLYLSGCASLEYEKDLSQSVTPRGETRVRTVAPSDRKALTDIHLVRVGMRYDEVIGIMGDTLEIGYRQSEHLKTAVISISLENPFKAEMIEADGLRYEVLYYYTTVIKADDILADDELTPLVFRDKVLIGKGWDFLFELKYK